MAHKQMSAHLMTTLGKKHCSICKEMFAKDAKPSLSQAFAEHVRREHKSTPIPDPAT